MKSGKPPISSQPVMKIFIKEQLGANKSVMFYSLIIGFLSLGSTLFMLEVYDQ